MSSGTKNKSIKSFLKEKITKWADKGIKRYIDQHKKKKSTVAKVVVNNHMNSYGQMDPKTNVVEINKKKHKGDKAQLADTIHHELLHVKFPNMSEKKIKSKATREVKKMSPAQVEKFISII